MELNRQKYETGLRAYEGSNKVLIIVASEYILKHEIKYCVPYKQLSFSKGNCMGPHYLMGKSSVNFASLSYLMNC